MASTPFITSADPLPATTSVIQSQVPLVQTTPVVASQVVTAPSMVASTPVATAPQASYVPILSAVQQPQKQTVSTGIKVVPIYDDF